MDTEGYVVKCHYCNIIFKIHWISLHLFWQSFQGFQVDLLGVHFWLDIHTPRLLWSVATSPTERQLLLCKNRFLFWKESPKPVSLHYSTRKPYRLWACSSRISPNWKLYRPFSNPNLYLQRGSQSLFKQVFFIFSTLPPGRSYQTYR